jgi:hypothetical protein
MSDETILTVEELTKITCRNGSELLRSAAKNRGLLEVCRLPHAFYQVRPGGEVRCSRCGGSVEYSQAYWYMLGVSHMKEQS